MTDNQKENSQDYQEIENFQINYQMLSKIRRKIFDYLHWFSGKYTIVFPSQTTIAKKVGCCRDTVVQAIKKFRSVGLITTLPFREGRAPLMYFIHDVIQKLDLRKPSTWFKRQNTPKKEQNPTGNPTGNPTLVNELPNRRLNDCENVQDSSNQKKRSSPDEEKKVYKNHEELPEEMLNIDLSDNDKKILWYGTKKHYKASYNDRLQALRLACEDMATYKQRKQVYNDARFLTKQVQFNLEKANYRKCA